MLCSSFLLCQGGEGLAPFVYSKLGTKLKQMSCRQNRRKGRAVWVLKGDDEGGGGMGHIE
jgi:hypothetical protein